MEVSVSLLCLFVYEPLCQDYSSVLQSYFSSRFFVHEPPHCFPRKSGAHSGSPQQDYAHLPMPCVPLRRSLLLGWSVVKLSSFFFITLTACTLTLYMRTYSHTIILHQLIYYRNELQLKQSLFRLAYSQLQHDFS